MLKLTDEQKAFIEKHKIPLSWVMDATGIIISNSSGKVFDISKHGDFSRKYNKKELLKTMEKYEKHFLVNWKNCQKDITHDIRNKDRCIMCDEVGLRCIEETKRHHNKGSIYIAVSKSEEIIKIGLTENIENRKRSLNETCYGGINDWQIAYCLKSSGKAGEIESKTQSLLSNYLWNAEYLKNGRQQSTYELVKCSYKIAKNALNKVKQNYSNYIIEEWEMSDAEQLFNFDNVETHTRRIGNQQETETENLSTSNQKSSNITEKPKIIKENLEVVEVGVNYKKEVIVDNNVILTKENNTISTNNRPTEDHNSAILLRMVIFALIILIVLIFIIVF